MSRTIRALALALTLGLSACGAKIDPEANNRAVDGGYDVQLRWTRFGIAHVQAKDWGSLGFGVAYARATDGLCTLATEFVRVRGERARFFGGAAQHIESDTFFRALLTRERLARMQRGGPPELGALTAGYVAGYNRYLRDHPPQLRPQRCRDAAWVQPITREDLARLDLAMTIEGGLGRAQAAIVAARPPNQRTSATADNAGTAAATDAEATFTGTAIAFGRATTTSARGLLFANAYSPWSGADRLHLMHLRIPGVLDSMGAGRIGARLVELGFNKDVAWTHTAATAVSGTLYALQLVPGQALQYRWGNGVRSLQRVTVEVEVWQTDGSSKRDAHAIYMSHLGPVLMDESLPWTAAQVFVLRDANLDNNRSVATAFALNRARSISDVLQLLSKLQGVASSNTVAADRAGNTVFAAQAVTPNIDYPFLVRCQLPELQRWHGTRVIALRGEPACEWPNAIGTAAPGLLPSARMPALVRDDYLVNANDSHWFGHPDARLEGFSPVLGAEGTTRSLRTRAAFDAVARLLARGGHVSPARLQPLLDDARSFAADRLRADVLQACEREGNKVELANGNPSDVSAACTALQAWDGRFRPASRGALLWDAFWPRAARVDNLWQRSFRIADPLGTPDGINLASQPVREGVLRALSEAIDELAGHGIALNAALADVQYSEHAATRIAIPGGPIAAGTFSVIETRATDGTRRDVRYGNGYAQIVGWDDAGALTADAQLAYSQSEDADSPHHVDLTSEFSAARWLRLPFTDSEIEAELDHEADFPELQLLDAR